MYPSYNTYMCKNIFWSKWPRSTPRLIIRTLFRIMYLFNSVSSYFFKKVSLFTHFFLFISGNISGHGNCIICPGRNLCSLTEHPASYYLVVLISLYNTEILRSNWTKLVKAVLLGNIWINSLQEILYHVLKKQLSIFRSVNSYAVLMSTCNILWYVYVSYWIFLFL